MENFLSLMAEVLEVDAVDISDELNSFDAWDSLTILSIIAFCDSEYSVQLSAEEINDSNTILGLRNLVENKMN